MRKTRNTLITVPIGDPQTHVFDLTRETLRQIVFFICDRVDGISEGMTGPFCQSPKWFIHPQIITAVIERLSYTSSGPRSLVDALGATKSRWLAQTEDIHVRCEGASMHPRGRRPAGRSGRDRGTSSIGVHPNSTTRCDRALPCGNNQWVEAAKLASAHRI
jgi:hypothetical protein